TIGSTSITFVQIAGAGTYSAGDGLQLSGNQFSANYTVARTNGSFSDTGVAYYNGSYLNSTNLFRDPRYPRRASFGNSS
ncbi:MAG: hypothetical protein ACEQSB_06745, partial [Undibacterium sp.]